eukprot:CAMPEP_0184990006 /NCGR_PEP_ID=MMETSP1098-20130426/30614_1 /TAXON_ID=89044 /ORGANISM="Spumella elongata, Strain CCAP 955/1" /LENGTH=79 /DNA_ID=CAMNT_0027515123 /DNA_START=44 /DNA_END=283 /DNA_ORIENTATION=-
MTRGNQREIDRARAAARHAGKGEAKEGDHLARKENDANALKEKVAAKKAREEAIARGEILPDAKKGSGGVVKKKDGSKK